MTHLPLRTRSLRLLLPCMALMLSLLAAGCKRNYEEFYFKGTVIDGFLCSGTMVGYAFCVEKPAGIGDTLTVGGTRYVNVVYGYRAPRRLSVGETTYGVAYLYKDFSALNCVVLPLHRLPEMQIISVDEEPSVVGE